MYLWYASIQYLMEYSTITNSSDKQKRIAGSYIHAILTFLVLVFIDQISKYMVDHNMDLHGSIPIIKDVFEIHYIRNPGAAWGMFANKQIWFFICTIIFLSFGCICYIRCTRLNRFRDVRIVLVIIMSGAMGNFIDRLRFQYVIDFFYFKLIDFPVFNIADCYVTVGCILLFILFIFRYKEDDMDELIQTIHTKK